MKLAELMDNLRDFASSMWKIIELIFGGELSVLELLGAILGLAVMLLFLHFFLRLITGDFEYFARLFSRLRGRKL